MAIKVRAKGPGHYGRYREAGQEFDISSEKHFSDRWMEKFAEAKAPAKKGSSKEKSKPEPKDEEVEAPASDDVI